MYTNTYVYIYLYVYILQGHQIQFWLLHQTGQNFSFGPLWFQPNLNNLLLAQFQF